jgi:[acyl-carrier-protein] S-malonyltransferase
MVEKTINGQETAFVFPGIGIRLCGDEQAFYRRHSMAFDPFFAEASSLAKTDLASSIQPDIAESLSERNIQYLTFAFSAGMWQALSSAGIRASYVAGNSFGLYAALYAAGVVSFSDGLRIIGNAYECLTKSCRIPVSASVTIGLTADDVDALTAGIGALDLRRTNTFNDTCHVVCGPAASMEKFAEHAVAAGAINVVRLKVSLPYHHETLACGASAAFEESIGSISLRPPSVPVVSTMGRLMLIDPGEIRKYIVRHLSSPIDWHGAIRYIYSGGDMMMIECGPGISLTQNARFIAGSVKYVNVKNIRHRLGL